jgi:hypothetical protein
LDDSLGQQLRSFSFVQFGGGLKKPIMVQVARLIAGWLRTALVAGGSGGDLVGNSGCDSVDDDNNNNKIEDAAIAKSPTLNSRWKRITTR